MDPTNRPSPRRQLQGTRPPPLRVSKESTKIRKPPPHPAPRHVSSGAAAPPPSDAPRRPIIIYDASPKIIHTKPSDFMSLVQRLTGQNSEAGPSATSPAARYASIERSVTPRQTRNPVNVVELNEDVYGYSVSAGPGQGLGNQPGPLSAFPFPPGILSPMPSNLPPVSPGFFSPLGFDPSCLLHDLSPIFQGPIGNNGSNVGYLGNGNYVPSSPLGFSPSVLLGNPMLPSPGFNFDMLNNLPEF